VLYVRHAGRVDEHPFAPHPLHAFDSAEQEAELASRLQPLLR